MRRPRFDFVADLSFEAVVLYGNAAHPYHQVQAPWHTEHPETTFPFMPSFQDSVFLFILALLLFGPKRLPKLARELGKWVGEFRRASNEFKMQMDEELRVSEQAERQQKIAAMEVAAPVAQPMIEASSSSVDESQLQPAGDAAATEMVPIASSGELTIMPPATGLPAPQRQTNAPNHDTFGGLVAAIPAKEETVTAHGD